MEDRTKKFYNVFAMQHKILQQELDSWSAAEQQNYNAFELADSSYALREVIKLMEDTVKELKKQERMAHAKCGMICVTAEFDDKLKTPYCTAKVEVQQLPELPKLHKDPEQYTEFMQSMGVPDDMIQLDMLRLNWKVFIDWYNKRLAAGYPTPKGIDVSKTIATAVLHIRKKKEIEFVKG